MKLIFLSLFLALTVSCKAEENVTMPESIKDVKTKHEARLMSNPGVVSVGLGLNNKGEPVIIVGIESRDNLNKIMLPEELDGYPVKVQIIGTIRAQ